MSRLKLFYVSLCMVVMACTAEATSPKLSIALLPPTTLRISWPTNFPGWQLNTTTNLVPANWQPMAQAAVPSNTEFVVIYPFTNKSGYFRLQLTNTICVFQATPPVIMSGESSTLTWCCVPGTTYRLSPGPGTVSCSAGGFVVSPTKTTVYTLISSNAADVETNYATVIVNPCGFAGVSNWTGTMNLSYSLAPSGGGFSFNVNHSAEFTFNLTRSGGSDSSPQFTGTVGGTGTVNDREDDSSSGDTFTTIDAGTNTPRADVSFIVMAINCESNTYFFSVNAAIDDIETQISDGITTMDPATDTVGLMVTQPRQFSQTATTITDSTEMPARGPTWFSGGEYFEANDAIANDMFTDGLVTDTTAGTASVSWSFVPAPGR